MDQNKSIKWQWKRNLVLWLAGWASAYSVIPYVWGTQAPMLREAGLTIWILAGIVTIQGGLYFLVASMLGGWASEKVGLHTPLLKALITKTGFEAPVLRRLGVSAGIGVIAGLITLGMSALFSPHLPAEFHAAAEGITWQGLPASFYGGIGEEILMRFFLLSLLTLGLTKVTGRESAAFWIANIGSALVFGAGHILGVVGSIPITPLLWAYAILLNGWLALLFGTLYRRYGLESAMVAHFSVDIVLHVLPVFFS